MALLTDDMDIETSFFRIIIGGNGDYYPQIIFKDKEGLLQFVGIRVAISGGNAPADVKLAVAHLHRVLERYELNEYPDNKQKQ